MNMAVVDNATARSVAATYYRPISDECEVFRLCHRTRRPLMIKGPTGCGKSRLVEAMAETLGRPLVTVACHEDTSATDLLGRYLIEGGDTTWQDGPVTRAVRQGAILYLDEVAEAREDVVVVLHPLADHRRQLFVDRLGERLDASDDFMLVVSFNPGYRQGLRELKASTRQRFIGLSLGYPGADAEAEVVARESGVEPKVARRLVGFARKVRQLDELGLVETVSTRLLIGAAMLIASGLAPRRACMVGVIEALTDDAEVREAMADLASMAF